MPRFMLLASRFIYVLLAAIAAVLVVFVSQNWGIALPLVILGHTSKALPLAMWVGMALGLGSITTLLITGLTPSSQGERSPVSRPSSRFSSRSARPTPPSDAPRSPSARTSTEAWDDWQADPPRRSSSSSRQGPEQFASWSRDSQEKSAPTSTQRDRPRAASTDPQPWGETWERPWQRKWESWDVWAETGPSATQGDRPERQPPVTDAEVISASPSYESAYESVYEPADRSTYSNAEARESYRSIDDRSGYASRDYASADYTSAEYSNDPDYDSEVNDSADEFEVGWEEETTVKGRDSYSSPSPDYGQDDELENDFQDEFEDEFDDLEELDRGRQNRTAPRSPYGRNPTYSDRDQETFLQDNDLDQDYGDRYDNPDRYDDQDRYDDRERYESDRYPAEEDAVPSSWENWVESADEPAIAQAWYVLSEDNLGEYDDDYAADVIDVEAKVAEDDLGDELENWDDWETEGDRSNDLPTTPTEPAHDTASTTANIYEVRQEPVSRQQQGTLYSYVYRKPDEQDSPDPPSASASTPEFKTESTESATDSDRILIPPYHPDPSPDASPIETIETVETSDVEAGNMQDGKPVDDG